MSEGADAKGKGKAVDRLSDPSSSSSNPSASFSALWNYIEPALHHIVRSPTNSTEKAPAIDVAYYLNIHTATYSFFTNTSTGRMENFHSPIDSPVSTLSPTSPSSGGTGRDQQPGRPHGTDLYEKLDKYYAEVCQEILAGHPIDDSNLIDYILPCFQRYRAGAQSVHRLLNYVNRQFVRRSVEEDRGWLRLADILFLQTQPSTTVEIETQSKSAPVTPISPTSSSGKSKSSKKKKKSGGKSGTSKPPTSTSSNKAGSTADNPSPTDAGGGGADAMTDSSDPNRSANPRELIASRLQKRRNEELQKWGYTPGVDAPERLQRAEAAAEAASPLDRIVPLYALALRRFRTEVLMSLLAIPKNKKGGKTIKAKRGGATLGIGIGGGVEGAGGEGKEGPKSRLARAVRYLVEEDTREEEVRRKAAAEVNDMMEVVGVPGDHVLRKKLTKFSAVKSASVSVPSTV